MRHKSDFVGEANGNLVVFLVFSLILFDCWVKSPLEYLGILSFPPIVEDWNLFSLCVFTNRINAILKEVAKKNAWLPEPGKTIGCCWRIMLL